MSREVSLEWKWKESTRIKLLSLWRIIPCVTWRSSVMMPKSHSQSALRVVKKEKELQYCCSSDVETNTDSAAPMILR